MSAVSDDTPYYVLMEANRRIGPRIMPLPSGFECAAVYGFSGKGPYDKFRANSPGALTPYPLVEDYLRTEVGTAGRGLKLVVLEAAGPQESYVQAATVEAVLEAQEKRATHVTATHQLTFDAVADGYRVDESSVKIDYPLPSLCGKVG
jgi:hypothetical protein